jgi:hypothetical protein
MSLAGFPTKIVRICRKFCLAKTRIKLLAQISSDSARKKRLLKIPDNYRAVDMRMLEPLSYVYLTKHSIINRSQTTFEYGLGTLEAASVTTQTISIAAIRNK